MANFIVHHNGVFNVWSTVADGMMFESGMTRRMLEQFIPSDSIQRLDSRITRAQTVGSSSHLKHTLEDLYRVDVFKGDMTYEGWLAKFFEFQGKTVYVDMDDVLVEFHDFVSARFGVGIKTLTKTEFWNRLMEYPNIYSELPIHPDAKRLMQMVDMAARRHGYRVCVLTATAMPSKIPLCVPHKLACIEEHFPGTFDRVVTCLRQEKKNFCKPGDILIDDRDENCEEWEEQGGTAILYTDFAGSIGALRTYLMG